MSPLPEHHRDRHLPGSRSRHDDALGCSVAPLHLGSADVAKLPGYAAARIGFVRNLQYRGLRLLIEAMIRNGRRWIGLTNHPAWRRMAENWGLNRLPSKTSRRSRHRVALWS